MRIETIDLNFLNTEHIIASFLLLGERDAAIVETGPTSCLEHLKRGLEDHGVSQENVRHVFLTHIHLDHAGASGHLAELLPNATFYVHEVGYPHLVDPSKLLTSATRIYGERMDELWAETRPVPEDRIEILKGGEKLEAADGVLTAHYTPGHAYHHLAYLEPDSGALFMPARLIPRTARKRRSKTSVSVPVSTTTQLCRRLRRSEAVPVPTTVTSTLEAFSPLLYLRYARLARRSPPCGAASEQRP
jgi:hypothetical protein